jgi:hypothetical protein
MKRILVALLIAIASTTMITGQADATLVSCPIADGPYRVVAWWGCGAVAYVNGTYVGYVADMSAPDPGCTRVEYQTIYGNWQRFGLGDCSADGNSAYIDVSGLPRANLRIKSGNYTARIPYS